MFRRFNQIFIVLFCKLSFSLNDDGSEKEGSENSEKLALFMVGIFLLIVLLIANDINHSELMKWN